MIEVLKQALEALEFFNETAICCADTDISNEAITSLRQAIAELESQEQVSYSGNGTAGRENAIAPTGFFFQMPKESQEPVAWMHPSGKGYDSAFRDHSTVMVCTGNKWDGWIPLYTHPQRTWIGLTDEEITALKHNGERYISSQDFARAVEAKLKDKNT